MIKEDLIILSSTHCPGCEALKKKIGDQVKVYDIQKSDDAVDLALKEKIMAVPSILYRKNGKWSQCKIAYEKNKVVVNCEGKIFKFNEKKSWKKY